MLLLDQQVSHKAAWLVFVWFCLGASTVSAAQIRKGQWAEWAVTLPPPASVTELEDAASSDQGTVSLRCRISVLRSDGKTVDARVQIKSRIFTSSVVVTEVDIATFKNSRVLIVKRRGVKADEGKLKIETGTLTVLKRKWTVGDGTNAIQIERWDSLAMQFGPALLRFGDFEMKIIAFGDLKPPVFPYPVKEKKTETSEQTDDKENT